MLLVPDANAIIYLAKADLLEVLDRYEVVVPEVVVEETVVRGKEEGHADAYILERHVDRRWTQAPLEDPERLREELSYFGDPSEAHAFLVARLRDGTVVTTDRVARRRLRARRVEVVQTDILLYRRFAEANLPREDLVRHLLRLLEVGGTTEERMHYLLMRTEREDEEMEP